MREVHRPDPTGSGRRRRIGASKPSDADRSGWERQALLLLAFVLATVLGFGTWGIWMSRGIAPAFTIGAGVTMIAASPILTYLIHRRAGDERVRARPWVYGSIGLLMLSGALHFVIAEGQLEAIDRGRPMVIGTGEMALALVTSVLGIIAVSMTTESLIRLPRHAPSSSRSRPDPRTPVEPIHPLLAVAIVLLVLVRARGRRRPRARSHGSVGRGGG